MKGGRKRGRHAGSEEEKRREEEGEEEKEVKGDRQTGR